MQPLVVTGLPAKARLSLSFTAIGSSLFVTLSGAGWGAATVDAGNELILLFSNDSTVTLRATSLQSFEPGLVQNTFTHQYSLKIADLSAISTFELAGLRKYSFNSFSDLTIPKENSERLKRTSKLFAAELEKANFSKTVQQIGLQEIRNFIGDSVTFCCRVYKTRYFQGSENGPTVLDVQANFSDPPVNVLILERDRDKFNNAPENRYLNKDVCISGVVEMRNNIPSVIIRNKEQIQLKSPVSLDEISFFEGDTVTVAGKVFTAYYAHDSDAQHTYLNVGAPDPDQPLTLLIGNDDRPEFGMPEIAYLNKMVRVVGKVERLHDKLVIALHDKRQIEVLEDADNGPAFVSLQGKTARQTNPVASKNGLPQNEAGQPAETEAEFPGGTAGFQNFLEKNINNPLELKPREKKKVVVAFRIDQNGLCRDIKIVESAGYVFDEEVKRVLLKMPKWKPASYNGNVIASRLTLPITFKGEETENVNK